MFIAFYGARLSFGIICESGVVFQRETGVILLSGFPFSDRAFFFRFHVDVLQKTVVKFTKFENSCAKLFALPIRFLDQYQYLGNCPPTHLPLP